MLPAGSTTDWDLMVNTLTAQSPIWEPGEKFGYHAATFGWLIGPVIRDANGKRVGEMIQEKIAEPLDVDFLLGFGPEHDNRVSALIDAPAPAPGVFNMIAYIIENFDSVLACTFVPSIPDPSYSWNSRAERAAEIPATNGHTNARALAKIYGVLANG